MVWSYCRSQHFYFPQISGWESCFSFHLVLKLLRLSQSHLHSLWHTAWCHCQAWPHVPVTPKDAEQHQPHHQPQLTQLWFSFCFIFSLTHQIWREEKQMTDDFGTCCCWLLKEKHFEMSTTALFAFIYGCFPIACLICVCKYSSGTQHNFHSKCLTLFLTPLHSW